MLENLTITITFFSVAFLLVVWGIVKLLKAFFKKGEAKATLTNVYYDHTCSHGICVPQTSYRTKRQRVPDRKVAKKPVMPRGTIVPVKAADNPFLIYLPETDPLKNDPLPVFTDSFPDFGSVSEAPASETVGTETDSVSGGMDYGWGNTSETSASVESSSFSSSSSSSSSSDFGSSSSSSSDFGSSSSCDSGGF